MAKLWSEVGSPSEGTQRNRRKRGSGTWGHEAKNLTRVEQRQLRERRGSGGWGTESAKLYRLERQKIRQERRSKNLLYKLLMG
jgi:hypothetical protein